MAYSRRQVLALVGGGTIVAAGARAGWFVTSRTPERALAPWGAAGSYSEPRKRALSYAILAPNAHNLQPWRVDLREAGVVTVYRDPASALPQTDPHDRQITISLGCFLELLTIAASDTGHTLETTLFPQGQAVTDPVARVRFRQSPTQARDPLFAHILARRSCKEPFSEQLPNEDVLAPVRSLATVITEEAEVAALRAVTWQAWQIEAQTPRTHRESVELMRMGKAEINAQPDGIDLGGPFLETLMLAGLLSREAQLDPSSQSYAQGVEIYRTMLAATPAYVMLSSPTNTRGDQIAAGRAWMRLNLTTTSLGLALHPVSQALQEYAEMRDVRAQVHGRWAAPGATIQMLGRLGYGPQTPQTPRWPLEARERTV